MLYVTSRDGGLCYGVCEPHKTYTIYEDGVYTGHDRLTNDEIQQIKSFTHTLAQHPNTGEGSWSCQSYVDGSDSVWIIPNVKQQIIPCKRTDPSSVKMIERLEHILYN